MTWEEAGLKSNDPVINDILHSLAARKVSSPKLQEIKRILDGWDYTVEFHVQNYTPEARAIVYLESQDFMVYKKHCGRAVVK